VRFFAVHRAVLRIDPFLSAPEGSLDPWVRLGAYAAELEHDRGDLPIGEAVIPKCHGWTDRAWLAAAGVTCAGVAQAVEGGLCYWEGNDLVVRGFDREGLQRVRKLRENGRRGGRPPKSPGYPEQRQSGTGAEPPPSDLPRSDLPRSDQPRPPRTTGKARAVSRAVTEPPDFVSFFERYPRKDNRPRALRSWLKERPPLDAILADIQRREQSGEWRDPQYIPQASTYLNNRRWTEPPRPPRVQRAAHEIDNGSVVRAFATRGQV
jgi:hypothetical protein